MAAKARQSGVGASPPRDESHPAALRQEWQRLHRMPAPPALSPDFLLRDIAYHRQAEQHGSLSADARRRLAALVSGDIGSTAPPRVPSPRVKAGSTLLREWHGRTYTVLALDKGFEMAGQRFASLSEIAHHITGAHWSGPRFFGLRRATSKLGAGTARNA